MHTPPTGPTTFPPGEVTAGTAEQPLPRAMLSTSVEKRPCACIDVITQISAVQAALDKVALGLLDGHARHCVVDGRAEGSPEELTDELMAAVGRLMRRG